MEKIKTIRDKRIFMILINIIMLVLLMNIGVYAYTGSSRTTATSEGGSGTESSNFSVQNVITSVKNFNEAGKKTDGGIDAKAMGDKFAEQLKPIGDLIISVGMIVCVAVTMIFGMKFIAASKSGQEIAKLKTQFLGFAIASLIFVSAYPIWSFIVQLIGDMVAKI